MSQFFDDVRATTSSHNVKRFLDIMEDYEATHTHEETGRMWAWIRDYLEDSKEV